MRFVIILIQLLYVYIGRPRSLALPSIDGATVDWWRSLLCFCFAEPIHRSVVSRSPIVDISLRLDTQVACSTLYGGCKFWGRDETCQDQG